MNKTIIIPISIVAALIVIALVVWFLLPRSSSEQLPGSKDMADTVVHLMEMEKLLEQKSGQTEEPKLCNCCNSTLIGGQCPICMGGCDNSLEYKMPRIPKEQYEQTKISTGDTISNVVNDRDDGKY